MLLTVSPKHPYFVTLKSFNTYQLLSSVKSKHTKLSFNPASKGPYRKLRCPKAGLSPAASPKNPKITTQLARQIRQQNPSDRCAAQAAGLRSTQERRTERDHFIPPLNSTAYFQEEDWQTIQWHNFWCTLI